MSDETIAILLDRKIPMRPLRSLVMQSQPEVAAASASRWKIEERIKAVADPPLRRAEEGREAGVQIVFGTTGSPPWSTT
jgi:hypothetical protein